MQTNPLNGSLKSYESSIKLLQLLPHQIQTQMKQKIIFGLVLILLLSVCVAADPVSEKSEPNLRPPHIKHCPRNKVPVCATKDGTLTNYTNKCFAELDGATDITQGYCPRPCPYAARCFPTYQPVCGTNVYGVRQTYLNPCNAGGGCALDVTPYPCGSFTCTEEFTNNCNPNVISKASVCGGKDQGTTTLYANSCTACKAGSAYTVISVNGACPDPFA